MKKWTVGARIMWRYMGKLYRGVVVEPRHAISDTKVWILLDNDPAYGAWSSANGTVGVDELEFEDLNL